MSEDIFVDPESFVEPRPASARSGTSAILLWLCIIVCAGVVLGQIVYVRGVWYRFFSSAEPASVDWRRSLNDAVSEADRTGKPLLLSFVSASSAYSQAMRHEVWCDPRLRPLVASRFIPVRISVDANPGLASEFRIDTTPTVLILNGKVEVFRESGFIAAYDLAFQLQRAVEPQAIASY